MKNLGVLFIFAFLFQLSAVEIPLKNPSFQSVDGKITSWLVVNASETETFTTVPYKDGKQAIKLTSTGSSKFFGIQQGGFDLQQFPRPEKGEKLQIRLIFQQKNENVQDGGFVNFSFFSKDGYLIGRDGEKMSGSFDWGEREVITTFQSFPEDAAFFAVKLFLGRTSGTVYFAEPKLYLELVK